MKVIPGEFSNSAWDCFILSKEKAHNNFQQNVDSENLLLALIEKDSLTREILKKNDLKIQNLEKELISLFKLKAKMKN